MVSINNIVVHFYRILLDIVFPLSDELRSFIALDESALATLARPSHHATLPLRAVFPYRHPLIKSSIRSLKYKRNIQIAERYARVLACHITDQTKDESCVLIPMPASRRRMRVYGFNQCEMLTGAMMSFLDGRFNHRPLALARSDTHVSQTKLGKRERLANVVGAFIADPSISGQRVIIVDDVYTTGATAAAAIAACRAAGARHIEVWTIAH